MVVARTMAKRAFNRLGLGETKPLNLSIMRILLNRVKTYNPRAGIGGKFFRNFPRFHTN